jgi:transcriptional regulator with XRE-family HTH domain
MGLQQNGRMCPRVGKTTGEAQVGTPGPVGSRRRLGAELRRLRTGAGLHLDQVAVQLRCSTSKISRLETGKGIPKSADVRELIRIYGVTAETERDMLLRLVRESRTEGWWEPYTEGVATERFFLDAPGRYAALETDAVALLSFDCGPFHGLLQTPDYARAVLSAQLPHHSAQAIAQLVELRMRRQDRLHGAEPLRVTAVIDESVLLRQVGGPEVMAAQLRHLLDLMELPHVVVRILPFTAGLRRAHMDHFMLLEIPDDLGSDLVYIEGHAGETFLESESDVDTYRDVFADALARSLDAGASRAAVRRCAARFAPPRKASP